MNMTDRQTFGLATRRFRRALAEAIYPPYRRRNGAADDEFQRGLEAGIQAEQWQQEIRDARKGQQ